MCLFYEFRQKIQGGPKLLITGVCRVWNCISFNLDRINLTVLWDISLTMYFTTCTINEKHETPWKLLVY